MRGSARRRPGVAIVAALTVFGLVAGACSNKKDDDSVSAADTEAPVETDAATDESAAPDEATDTTAAAEVTTTLAELEPVMGGKLIVAGEADVGNGWIPSVVQCDSFCQMRARTFFDTITVVDQDLNWQPHLAESITPNADNTEFTIKLRSGIKFHDGTDLNADVAMFNFNNMAKSLLIGAALKDVAKDADGNAVMTKVDDLTYTITTAVPWPLFPYALSLQAGMVGSKQWVEAALAGTADQTLAVGTGPFMVESYAPGDKMIVKKNPNYWVKDEAGNALPYLDEIEFRVITDSQVASTALRGGDIDMFASSDSGVVGSFQDDPDFVRVLQDQYSETNYLLINLSKPESPLSSREVRCALGQAFDKQELIDVVYNGFGVPANGPFSPGQEGHLEDNGSLPYDPDAAAAAIEAYEADNGPVKVIFSTTTSATNLARAQFLSDVWGAIGVDVEINQIEQSKLINNALLGDPAFDLFGWRNHAGLFVDGQNFWWHGEGALPPGQIALNFGRLDDPVINENLDLARSEADPEVRKGYAEAINKQFAKECYILPINYTDWGVMMKPSVHGVANTPLATGDGKVRDAAGFPGQIYFNAVFLG